MNLGQFLTTFSPLSSATVAQHLAAIGVNVGTGTGPGQTIFASRFSVVAGEDRFTVMRKAKSQSPKDEAVPRQVRQPKATNGKALFSVAHTQGAMVSAQADSIVVIQKTQPVVATSDLGTVTVNRKRKSP